MDNHYIQIHVPANKARERLDTFLTREISGVSRSQIQKLIKQGCVRVDSRVVRPNYVIHPSEKIEIEIVKHSRPEIKAENIPIDIVYEDDYLLVVNKRAGMVVHPACGNWSGTLVNALMYHCQNLSNLNQPDRPGIVHRLDKDTSGLLVVAKDNFVHAGLSRQFEKKTIKRMYIAVVWGHFKTLDGTIETLLSRSRRDRKKIAVSQQGRSAITHFIVKERLPLCSLLELRLETGRTHQIRVHLAHIHHPVFGDQTYGGRGRQIGGLNKRDAELAMELLRIMPRQALHAKSLGFVHPVTGREMMFDSELPEDMKSLLNRLREATD